jgi:hypothetical protein
MADEVAKGGSPSPGTGTLALMDMLSHDLANHQQAALGFLELLDRSPQLGDAERRLIGRTVESLGRSARLLLQVRALLAHGVLAGARMAPVNLERASEAARKAVEGVFFTHNISIDTSGVKGAPHVRADELLAEVLTQLLVLLADSAPTDRECALRVDAKQSNGRVHLSLASEGFALDPLVTEALTSARSPPARTRASESISLVRDVLSRYGARARLERAPQGTVGSLLVIDLAEWGGA